MTRVKTIPHVVVAQDFKQAAICAIRIRQGSMFASFIARSQRPAEFSHSLNVPEFLFDADACA